MGMMRFDRATNCPILSSIPIASSIRSTAFKADEYTKWERSSASPLLRAWTEAMPLTTKNEGGVMRSGQMGGDVNWVVKQFIEELKNKWSDFTFEMLLATVEEKRILAVRTQQQRYRLSDGTVR